jgi:hypothetical protein
VNIHAYFGTARWLNDLSGIQQVNGVGNRPDVFAVVPRCKCASASDCLVAFDLDLLSILPPAMAWALAGLNRCVNVFAITSMQGNVLLTGSGTCGVFDLDLLNSQCSALSFAQSTAFGALTKDSGIAASFNASMTGEMRARAVVVDYRDGRLDLSLGCLPRGKTAIGDLRVAGATLHDTFKFIVRRMNGQFVAVGPPSERKGALAPLPRSGIVSFFGVPNEQVRVQVFNVPLDYYGNFPRDDDFNTTYTFMGRSVPTFEAVVQVNCRCRHTATVPMAQLGDAYDLRLSNNLNGQIQFDFSTPFSCTHLRQVAFRKMGQSSPTTETSQESSGGCDSRSTLTSMAPFVRGLPAASRHSAQVLLTTTQVQNVESMTLEQAFVVPLDVRFEVRVMTDRQSPIRNRAVTVEVRDGLAATLTPQLFAPFDNATGVSGRTITGVTDNNGLLKVRVLIAAATEMANAPQSITVVATPAAMVGSLMLMYGGCDGGAQPCAQTVQLSHEDGVTTAPRRLTFTDQTVVTMSGRVLFAGSPCAVSDVVVQAFEAPFNPDSTPMAEGDAAADGSFSFVVLQGTDVVVRVMRKKSPQYEFVNSSGAKVVNRFAVPGATGDVVLAVPFAAAVAIVGGVGVLPELTLPIVGGTCGVPLAFGGGAPRITLKSPACPNGELLLVGAAADTATGGSFAAARFASVPPLQFDLASFGAGAADARVAQYFAARGAAQKVDARLPQLDAKVGMSATRVSRDALTLQSLLGADLLAHLPLDSSLIDRSAIGHEAAATTAAALVHDKPDTSLNGHAQIAFNGSAIGLGRPPTLDAGGALTFAAWLRVDTPPMPTSASVATLFSLRNTNPSAPNDALLVRIHQGFASYAIDVQHNGAVVAGPTSALAYAARVHVAVTVADNSRLVLTVHADETSSGRQQLSSGANQSFRRRSLATCTERFQYDCVREVTIGAERNFGANEKALFRGALDDVAVWQRVLSDSDIAFIVAAGRDGAGLDKLASVLPRHVYRVPLQIELPASERRVFSQDTRLGVNSATLDDVLRGQTANTQRCNRRQAGGAALEPFEVHPVRQGDALGVLAHVFETYNNVRCYRVAGEVSMRSTFTDACREIAGGPNSQPVSSCQMPMGPSSWGYKNFYGIIGAPKLLPANVTRMLLEEKTATELSLFIGEFGMTVKSPYFPTAAVASEVLYFVTSGVAAPPNPSVYSYPAHDVPLLRLHKPPGDQSSAFLERTWAKSTTLSLGLSNSQRLGVRSDVTGKVGAGMMGQVCAGGAGGPIVALITADACVGYEVHAWVGVSFGIGAAYARDETRSLSNMFSSSVLQRFETAVNAELAGKSGDVVVTLGMTILVSDAFMVRWENAPSCAITATYAPEWEPADELKIDTLQVTARVAVPQQIADWDKQIEVLMRDCNGAQRETFDSMLFKKRDVIRAYASANCTLPDKSRPTAEQAATIGGKIQTAVQGAHRWRSIKERWDSLLCSAIQAAPREDYYAVLENRAPCTPGPFIGVSQHVFDRQHAARKARRAERRRCAGVALGGATVRRAAWQVVPRRAAGNSESPGCRRCMRREAEL